MLADQWNGRGGDITETKTNEYGRTNEHKQPQRDFKFSLDAKDINCADHFQGKKNY